MSLSLSQKQNFYHDLGERLHSGIAFGTAVKNLSEDTSGAVRRFADALRAAAARGDSVAESFARQRPAVGDLEVSILTGCERSGRLESGCRYLSLYFQTLADSRLTILKGMAYPIFLLHFAVCVLPIQIIISPTGGFAPYLKAVEKDFFVFYASVFFLAACVWVILRAAEDMAWVDSLLRFVPLLGKVRRAFSLGRFCGTYEMQLQSGVNIMDSVMQAGKASQSAMILEAVRKMLPRIRAGEQVGSLLSKSGAFPMKMVRAIRLGEETGKLDEELNRLTDGFHKEAMARIATLSNWIPKILYLMVAGFVAYKIVTFYSASLSETMKMTE